MGKGREREKTKIIVPICSYPTHNRKFKKNNKKIQRPRYGFFSSQNRLEKGEQERKQKLLFPSVPTRHVIENSKKIAKKFKKLKNTIMDSIQAQIGWKMMRKKENKNYRSVLFLSDA